MMMEMQIQLPSAGIPDLQELLLLASYSAAGKDKLRPSQSLSMFSCHVFLDLSLRFINVLLTYLLTINVSM